MNILPAIDLYQGNVVRFLKGDPGHSKVYSSDPVQRAQQWEEEGAHLLHVVDLSAALGEGDNESLIETIVKTVKSKVQVGGGIRDLEKAQRMLSWGVERVIFGTKGMDEMFLRDALSVLGKDHFIVSVDVMDSFLAVEGWQKRTKWDSVAFIDSLSVLGVQWIIYTDISRDGTLEGANVQEVSKLAHIKGINIIFSGGIASLGDLKKIQAQAPFLWGVIIGKALYEKTIDFKEALCL